MKAKRRCSAIKGVTVSLVTPDMFPSDASLLSPE